VTSRSRRSRPTGGRVLIGALTLVLLGACSSGSGSAPATTPIPTTSGTHDEAASPDPNFDYGHTILITDNGFEPHWLVSLCCAAITWKNMTQSAVSVRFDHQLVASGAIAPGGTFSWKPHNVQSVTYHAVEHPSWRGNIQVNQSVEPSGTPSG